MSYYTLISVIGEIGMEGLKKFSSARHFLSWPRIANHEGYLFLDQKRKIVEAKRINNQLYKFGLTTDGFNLQIS